MYRLGIDLGGTKIEGVILAGGDRELFRHRIDTEQDGGYAHVLDRIKTLYGFMTREIGGAPHTFGIGTPGSISSKTGLLKNSNTLCLNGMPFHRDLERILDRQVRVENDANCFALAEALLGAGQTKQLVFGVILGTGCGGGIVNGGRILAGLQGIAGEWGHMSIDSAGPACYCGARGCVETLISGGGLEKLYAVRFGLNKNFRQIAADARAKDPDAAGFMKEFYAHFGRAMANLINILDPDIVVLGGGVSNVDELYSEGITEVRRQIFSDGLETPIVKNRLGDSAGVFGAALIGI